MKAPKNLIARRAALVELLIPTVAVGTPRYPLLASSWWKRDKDGVKV